MFQPQRGPLTAPALSLDRIRSIAPSAFAVEKHHSRSERYTYVPTRDVIEGLMQEGFVPTRAMQSKARDASRVEFTKHAIWFRRADAVPQLGALYPEIMLVNSHDGTSAFQAYAGLLRLVCMNGLLAGESVEVARVHHKGNAVRDVVDVSFRVIEDSRRSVDLAQGMSQIQLTRDQQLAFARSAHQLRFEGTPSGESYHPEQLLRVRRAEDHRSDLFTTLNVVQENLVRGGITGWQRDEHGRPTRRTTTRAVGSIDRLTALNRALTTLAEEMAKLVA